MATTTRKITYPKRGEVYLVNFDPTIGAEIKKTRPALIIQNDIANRWSPITIVAALTSQFDDPLNQRAQDHHLQLGDASVSSANSSPVPDHRIPWIRPNSFVVDSFYDGFIRVSI